MRRRGVAGKALVLLVATAILALAVATSLVAGSRVTSPLEVWDVLVGAGDAHTTLLVEERAPRALVGVVVGAALAVGGAIVQGITRNPLGDPGLIGVTIGASASVVTATALLGVAAGAATVWFAIPGALATVVLVMIVAGRARDGSMVPLVLAGAVVSAVLGTYVQAMILTMPTVFDSYRFWVIGSLAGADASTLVEVLPALVPGIVLALALASGLNALALGDDVAASLGVRVRVVRGVGILAATLLCAGATAAVGPIAFVGLAVPHVARWMVGVDHRWLLPASMLAGATLLVAADSLGRVIVRPEELMVGIVTAFAGAPFLLAAIRSGRAVRA